MDRRLEGKVAIVTGSAQGIGATFAKGLAEQGARVTVCDILDTANTVNIINQAGNEAIGLHTDVTDNASLANMVSETVRAFGGIDILVNNAAIFTALQSKGFEAIDEAEWDALMAVNVRGPFMCAKAVAPEMRKRDGGKIINICSGTVFKGAASFLHYVTSKGAILAMTRSLARELGDDNICVNAIAPGLTASEGIIAKTDENSERGMRLNIQTRAIKRKEYPEDLVGTCIFLSSPDSDFITGQTIVVDGGSAMH